MKRIFASTPRKVGGTVATRLALSITVVLVLAAASSSQIAGFTDTGLDFAPFTAAFRTISPGAEFPSRFAGMFKVAPLLRTQLSVTQRNIAGLTTLQRFPGAVSVFGIPASTENQDEEQVVSFIGRIEFATGQGPASVAPGDFDGDKHPDVAVANSDGTVSILMGRGDGRFKRASTITVGGRPQSVVVGNFNDDGHPDLAISLGTASGISILLGLGNGSFQTTSVIDVLPAGPLAVGDFDGDGRDDLAVLQSFESDMRPLLGTVSVLLAHGDGTFDSAPTIGVGRNPRSAAVGDFNADGHTDLAVVNAADGTVSILLGQGDGTFQTQSPMSVGTSPASVTVADFDFDGRPDLAILNTRSSVSILLGIGHGIFKKGPELPEGIEAVLVAAGDFNGDKRADIAVVNTRDISTVTVSLGHGDGTFETLPDIAVGRNPVALAVTDLNGNGAADVVTASPLGNTISVLLGRHIHGFQGTPVVPVGRTPSSVVSGDFNNDGYLDLATSNFTERTVSILLGQGNGSFQPRPVVAAPDYPYSMALGDFNGDRFLDLAMTNPGIGGGGNTVSIMLGRGDGSFQPAPTITVGRIPSAIVTGDFNSDGQIDLAVANDFDANLSILLGRGDGTFRQGSTIGVGRNPLAMVLGDLNGDGRPDLVVANTNQNPNAEPGSLSILLGRGDGTFQLPPQVPVGVRPFSVTSGDFNGDGRPDIAVINQFGTGAPIQSNISILLGYGDGTFQAAPTVELMGFSVLAGDFNNDGRMDLAVTSLENHVTILLGKGDGTFRKDVLIGVGTQPQSITEGDFDCDGLPDLATADYLSGAISILINNTKVNGSQEDVKAVKAERLVHHFETIATGFRKDRR